MYWITMMTAGGFLILLYLSRKEDTDEDSPFLWKPFCRIAMYLYKRCCLLAPELFSVPQVERDLQQLGPAEPAEYLRTGYYVKKIASSLAILLAGTLFAAAVRYSLRENGLLGENGAVSRGDYGEGTKDVHILADYGEKQFDFRVSVEPVVLTGEEMEMLFREFQEKLPDYIRGGNESLEEVADDLVLEESYGGYPVNVEWESSRPDILSDTGYAAEVEQPERVTLLAHLCYGNSCRTQEIPVTLVPQLLTEEERLYEEIRNMLSESQSSTVEEKEWVLPRQWQGESIVWKELVEDNSVLLWMASLAAAAAVYLLSDRDLHKKTEERKEKMRREYPEIVHKLLLFTGAGMTVRGAFQKVAGDYEARRERGGMESPAHEEMLYTCRELRAGVSEGASYEHFGRRTGLQEYIRLSTLLMQNLKRGNSTLLDRLREEAAKSAQEQLRQGKRMGEEAGTKLLVPMVLMLAVIMAMIMIPAFSGM